MKLITEQGERQRKRNRNGTLPLLTYAEQKNQGRVVRRKNDSRTMHKFEGRMENRKQK
jgi:hypothetical protein